MSAPEPQRQRMILTEDGELREPDPAITDEAQPIYCTNCGTANRVNSRFCRSCGESLDEQTLDSSTLQPVRASGRKSKRSAQPSVQPRVVVQQSSSSLAVEAVTLLFVTGMVISTAAITSSALLPIVILIAWALVEMARHGALQ